MKKEVILSHYIRGDKKGLSESLIASFFYYFHEKSIQPDKVGLGEPLSSDFGSPDLFAKRVFSNIDELIFFKKKKAYEGSILFRSEEKRFLFRSPYDNIDFTIAYSFFEKNMDIFIKASMCLLQSLPTDCLYFQPIESEKGDTVSNPSWALTFAHPTECLTLQWLTFFHKDILSFLETPASSLDAIKQLVTCEAVGEDYLKIQLSATPEEVYGEGYADLHDQVVNLLDPSGRKMVRGCSEIRPDIHYTFS